MKLEAKQRLLATTRYATIDFVNRGKTSADLLQPYLEKKGFKLVSERNTPRNSWYKFTSSHGALAAQYGATTYGWRLSGPALDSLNFKELAKLFNGIVVIDGKQVA